MTLREAIAALREAGYLETRRGPGRRHVRASTAAPTAGDDGSPTRAAQSPGEMGDALRDALDFRRVLEPGAAALAADRDPRRPRNGRSWSALPGRRRRDRDARRTRRVADSRLHLAIAAASGRRRSPRPSPTCS